MCEADRRKEETLRELFPEEVWIKILENVNDSSREAVSNASPYFRRLLGPARVYFLFRQVWSILGMKYEADTQPCYCDPFNENIGHSVTERGHVHDARVYNLPVFAVVLKLRLVCKTWCSGIENFYETLLTHYDLTDHIDRRRLYSGLDQHEKFDMGLYEDVDEIGQWTTSVFSPDELGTINKFLTHFRNTHTSQQNPFFGRSVEFNSDPDEISGPNLNQLFFINVDELLSKYGRHIWFCEFDIKNSWSSPAEYFIKIRDLVCLMPNLRVLYVYSRLEGSRLNDLQIKQIQSQFHSNPVPYLKNLEYLKFSGIPVPVVTSFASVNSHISCLEVLHGDRVDLGSLQLPNLKKLSVTFTNLEEFVQLENCANKWQIECLFLYLDEEFPYTRWSRVFQLFECWQSTLRDVSVWMPIGKTASQQIEIVEDSKTSLNLINIKRFRITTPNVYSKDFILPMKRLELLENYRKGGSSGVNLDLLPRQLTEKLETEERVGYEDKEAIHDSKIWGALPKLKRINTEEEDNGDTFVGRNSAFQGKN